MECPCPEANLTKSNVAKIATIKAPTKGAPQQKETSAEDPFLLSNDDDPVPNLEHDKFNLANQLSCKELLEAREEQNVIGDS